jgi:hypothetical protein
MTAQQVLLDLQEAQVLLGLQVLMVLQALQDMMVQLGQPGYLGLLVQQD